MGRPYRGRTHQPVAEGCGDAHSTADRQDNTTRREGRGITIANTLDNKRQLN